ncbi:MAG TPA: response regulator [Bacillota bacterium]|nr:response regulator [Bacillota bacterium]
MREPAILVVEDDPNDAFLLQRAFRKARIDSPVLFLQDGQEVLDYLQGSTPLGHPATGQPLPGLILLDLKMPLMDGFEVLQWLRARPAFGAVRVVVLSGMEDRATIERAYRLGADEFCCKPEDPTQLVQLVQRLTQSPVREPQAHSAQVAPLCLEAT